MEPFAISICPREGSPLFVEPTLSPELEADVRSDLSELAERYELDISVGSCGYNAEAATIIVAVIGILVFARELGGAVTTWIDLAAKLNAALRALRRRHGDARVSEPAAALLALQLLKERAVPIDGVELIVDQILPVENSSLPQHLLSDFKHHPDRFYLFAFRCGDGDTYVVCLRSSGELEFLHRLPTGSFLSYYGMHE